MQEVVTYFEDHPSFVAAAGTIVGAILSALFTWYLKNRATQALIADLRKENGDLRQQAGELGSMVKQLEGKCAASDAAVADLKLQLQDRDEKLGKSVLELGEKSQALAVIENRLQRAYQKDGQTYLEK